ncbi:unnamed protein product [Lactuca virosa]|uniref:Uncharacterized protein n=1 Tax=Lactuca virosa TaxID=75947 RepID=A0AAU9MBK3_9ASTR|nr:unnamed protein product [Lactuca virosa]
MQLMFNTSTTLLQSKKHKPKHPTSIVVAAAALIPFQIVAIDDEKETTMRLVGEEPRHLLQLFIASSPFRTFPYRSCCRGNGSTSTETNDTITPPIFSQHTPDYPHPSSFFFFLTCTHDHKKTPFFEFQFQLSKFNSC